MTTLAALARLRQRGEISAILHLRRQTLYVQTLPHAQLMKPQEDCPYLLIKVAWRTAVLAHISKIFTAPARFGIDNMQSAPVARRIRWMGKDWERASITRSHFSFRYRLVFPLLVPKARNLTILTMGSSTTESEDLQSNVSSAYILRIYYINEVFVVSRLRHLADPYLC